VAPVMRIIRCQFRPGSEVKALPSIAKDGMLRWHLLVKLYDNSKLLGRDIVV
jgi:hypothetical protein